jgi:hypothetical protein
MGRARRATQGQRLSVDARVHRIALRRGGEGARARATVARRSRRPRAHAAGDSVVPAGAVPAAFARDGGRARSRRSVARDRARNLGRGARHADRAPRAAQVRHAGVGDRQGHEDLAQLPHQRPLGRPSAKATRAHARRCTISASSTRRCARRSKVGSTAFCSSPESRTPSSITPSVARAARRAASTR